MYQCTLEKEGFLGTFYESETPTEKAIIFVGGSGENRENVEQRAQALCKEGFHVLSLGYYLWKPLSPHTVWIPIDYAEKAVAFLKSYDAVSIRKIGMTGLSLGAAYTLLCASYLPEISCVVSVSGFDFVVEGLSTFSSDSINPIFPIMEKTFLMNRQKPCHIWGKHCVPGKRIRAMDRKQ